MTKCIWTDCKCPCADGCPDGCYLIELERECEEEEGDFDIHADDAHNDPHHGQAKDLNRGWSR